MAIAPFDREILINADGEVSEPRPGREHRRRRHEGIEVRHKRACGSRLGRACSCSPSYQAQVWVPQDGRPIRRTFRSLEEARAWRQETQVAVRRFSVRAPSRVTVCEAAEAWMAAAQEGLVRTRSGRPYKPAALRTYGFALKTKLLPELGDLRLSSVTRNQIQDLVDSLIRDGMAPSSVSNAVLPLRAIYRRALFRGELAVNPTEKLALPFSKPRRLQVPRPEEAAALIEALPLPDRALWATALYAGLRRGELQALTWANIDHDQRILLVEHSWDPFVGLIEPKSQAGKRRVPISETLRAYLIAHRLQQGHSAEGFLFCRQDGRTPFEPTTVLARARRAWDDAGLRHIGLHECRHTYASFMIAAGVNTKALSTYMGHSTITITLDRYGHLLPGNEREAAGLLDSWLQAAEEKGD
jgi:integrase